MSAGKLILWLVGTGILMVGLVSLLVWFFVGRHTGYQVRDMQVYYITWDEGRGKQEHIVTTADAASLKNLGSEFAKDKNHVYWAGQVIPGADPVSFTRVSARWMSDDGFLSFDGYSKDSNHVYYYHSVIQNADPNTFSFLGEMFSKDSEHVFYEDKTIEGADIATFKLVDEGETKARDKDRAYDFHGNPITS